MIRNVLGTVCLAMCSSVFLAAWGIDPSEIDQMVRNQVDETVIINMVQQQRLNRRLTVNEIIELKAAGASPALLEYLTRPEAANATYDAPPPVTAAAPAPSIVLSEPPATYYPPATPYYVYPQYRWGPSYYSSWPYYYNYRPGYSFGFSYNRGGWHSGRHHSRHHSYRHSGPPRSRRR
ncbi:MAG: hypothetical protein FWG74_01350 [Planctomycetes bacterium]|nr:hypothetical protein [Planctomycetota bacterium]